MTFFRVLAGIAILILGRQLFWLFVGVVGFAFGIDFATLLFAAAPPSVVLLIALAAGIAGAVLAYVLQEAIIVVVGFLAGGYIGAMLFSALTPHTGYLFGVPFLIVGILGALLSLVVFDWAVILFSSLIGARLIVESMHASSDVMAVAYLALVAAGILVQLNRLARCRPH
jgi:hypothetical protein